MSDRTDTIHALQRAARSEGRRESAISSASRERAPRSTRRSTTTAGARQAAVALRDFAHFHVLRGAEAIGTMSERTRRISAGAGVATLLLVVVLTATAGADDKPSSTRATGAAEPARPHAARGTGSDETLIGTDRADRMNGRAGDDVILAGSGDDVVGGATGDDVLHGAGGNDTLFAGPGRDVLIGGAGDDQLRATNLDGKRDRLHCGPGTDVAWVVARSGRVEDITTGCERVNVIDVRARRR